MSPLINELVQALQVLPGIGPKGAQRIALQVLQRNRDGGLQLAASLHRACVEIGYCGRCRTLCETQLCQLCSDSVSYTHLTLPTKA